ncbi:MAG: hypothetical protein DRI61_14775 [Chloroflexi bacterium]|nr:MAG: hypothetical protein DRI61_14775 [Chloroflexota bacterium]
MGVEWIEILDEKWRGPLRLRVQGRSMSPSLRPGDQVIVERSRIEDLRPGDVILVRGRAGLFLHRFFGLTSQGELLTQGDASLSPDPPWPPEAFVGKATGVERDGRIEAIPGQSLGLSLRKELRRGLYFVKRLVRALLPLTLLFLLLAPITWAAVTLVSFTATPEGQAVVLRWETASEVNMLGFYIRRSDAEGGDYQRISDLIPAEGDIVGATYQFTDMTVEPGRTYFYTLEAVEVTGATEFYGPVSATVPQAPTPTPSPTVTPTPSPTPVPTSTPTAIPTPTFTPLPSPTPTPVPSPTPLATPTPTFTPLPSPTATPMPSPTPLATPTPTFTLFPAPSATPTSLLAFSPLPTPTFTPLPMLSPTLTSPLPSASKPSAAPTPTFTPVPEPTLTPSPAPTIAPKALASPTPPVSRLLRATPSGHSPAPTPVRSSRTYVSWLLWGSLAIGGLIGGIFIIVGFLYLRQPRRES